MIEMPPYEYFVCGGFGGICSVLVGHPLDVIKVRLQTMPVPKQGEQPHYLGTMDCAKKILKHEGAKGFYNGMEASLFIVAPIVAISFLGFGIGKHIFSSCPPYLQSFTAGAFSGLFTTFVTAPGERIKSLLQIQKCTAATKLYNGPVDVFKKLYKQGGITSIYRGVGVTLLREVPASGLYYFTYEAVKDIITDYTKTSVSILGTVLAGGTAGLAPTLVGLPADVLKSRLQTAPEGTYPNGLKDVFTKLLNTEGPLALYKGAIPVLLRAFPANAACFLGFELSKILFINS